jgi:acetyl-CoA C-acetyltransferase
MQNDPIVIVAAKRTPIGAFKGIFKDVKATELGSQAIKAALAQAKVSPNEVQEVIMGCVLPAGQGQAPARQAALGAGLAQSTHCMTVNKVCGSGLKSVMLASDALQLGHADVAVAGGMESMTNAPYLIPNARMGLNFGVNQILDSMALDGLEDAYDKGKSMGVFAENTAEKYGFTRAAQDEFAIASLHRAQKAMADGAFKDEITQVTIQDKKGPIECTQDETPTKVNAEKIPQLKPAFKKDGTVTAASSSSISDGAAALVLMRKSEAEKRGLKPLATIVAQASFSHEPAWFTTAPVGAMKNVLEKANWQIKDVDLFEINEAFAVVTMAAMHDLAIPHDKVNVNGGACAMGHPIGASGARILVTLLYALQHKNLKRGIASLCIGGGEAVAIAVERL